jgi:DNA-binding PadR family transcriptional regulator
MRNDRQGHGCGPRAARGVRGGWWGAAGPWGGGGFWGGGPGGAASGGRQGGFRGGRMFEQGDLKYVILQLLSEKPRHGYDIIKALEDRLGGTYSPSPGAVYPTLTMLEDMGYAREMTGDGGKKVFEITPEGRAYLEQNKGSVDEIFDRIAGFATSFFGPPMVEIHQAFKKVARATYATATHMKDADQLRRIRELLDRAATEIEAIGAEPKKS